MEMILSFLCPSWTKGALYIFSSPNKVSLIAADLETFSTTNIRFVYRVCFCLLKADAGSFLGVTAEPSYALLFHPRGKHHVWRRVCVCVTATKSVCLFERERKNVCLWLEESRAHDCIPDRGREGGKKRGNKNTRERQKRGRRTEIREEREGREERSSETHYSTHNALLL